MSTTSRMSAGLAFEPEKDLAMFAEEAAQGRHLAGVARLGHGWKFREGEPEDAIFDLAHERDPDSDFLFYFSEAGWEHVMSLGDAHVFKAAPGTPPVHSGAASRAEELLRERNRYAVLSAIALAIFVLVGLGLRAVDWSSWLTAGIALLAVLPVIYTVLPLIGFWHRGARLFEKA